MIINILMMVLLLLRIPEYAMIGLLILGSTEDGRNYMYGKIGLDLSLYTFYEFCVRVFAWPLFLSGRKI